MGTMLVEPTDTPPPAVTLRVLAPHEFVMLADQLISIYIAAMRYPPGTALGRRQLWLEHSNRPGFSCVVAVGDQEQLLAFGYGYTGRTGQWWHQEVQRGMAQEAQAYWLPNYFELTELHTRPDVQGRRLGEQVLQALLTGRVESAVLLSTPEGQNRAWRLYRRLGFVDVLRDYRFTGDPRPFGILGRLLPLDR